MVYERSANEEMVRQKLPKATRLLVPLSDHKKAFEMIRAGEADAFADLRYQTVANQPDMPGTRVVPGAIGHNALAIGNGKEQARGGGLREGVHRDRGQIGLRRQVDREGRRARCGPAVDVTAFLAGAASLYPRGIG